jgi:hypothetical protein
VPRSFRQFDFLPKKKGDDSKDLLIAILLLANRHSIKFALLESIPLAQHLRNFRTMWWGIICRILAGS